MHFCVQLQVHVKFKVLEVHLEVQLSADPCSILGLHSFATSKLHL